MIHIRDKDYLVCQVRAGAQLLQVFESHGGALNRELSREFTVPGLKRIASEVKKRLGPDSVPISIFARGGFFINEDFVDSDYDIIQLDWTVDGKGVRGRCPVESARPLILDKI